MIYPTDTTLLYAQADTTLGGTHLERLLKNFVHAKYHKTIIDISMIEDVVADIRDEAERLHKENPRSRAVEVTLIDNSHGCRGVLSSIFWIKANKENILTLIKARAAYLQIKEGGEQC